jgi:hypothetical protein
VRHCCDARTPSAPADAHRTSVLSIRADSGDRFINGAFKSSQQSPVLTFIEQAPCCTWLFMQCKRVLERTSHEKVWQSSACPYATDGVHMTRCRAHSSACRAVPSTLSIPGFANGTLEFRFVQLQKAHTSDIRFSIEISQAGDGLHGAGE